MNLKQLYLEGGHKALAELADKTGSSTKYLYLCATGRRQPGPKLVMKIARVDERFKKEEMRPDYWGDPECGAEVLFIKEK